VLLVLAGVGEPPDELPNGGCPSPPGIGPWAPPALFAPESGDDLSLLPQAHARSAVAAMTQTAPPFMGFLRFLRRQRRCRTVRPGHPCGTPADGFDFKGPSTKIGAPRFLGTCRSRRVLPVRGCGQTVVGQRPDPAFLAQRAQARTPFKTGLFVFILQ
jgi:hypothetical protein